MDNGGTVQIQIEGIDQLKTMLASYTSIAAPIIQDAVNAGAAVLAKYTTRGVVPFVTGNLLQSFRLETGNMFARWYPTANYAEFVYYGTKPHDIRPVNAKALFWPGAAHPVKVVHHPGSKANPFIDRIASQAQPEINQFFLEAVQKITEALAK